MSRGLGRVQREILQVAYRVETGELQPYTHKEAPEYVKKDSLREAPYSWVLAQVFGYAHKELEGHYLILDEGDYRYSTVKARYPDTGEEYERERYNWEYTYGRILTEDKDRLAKDRASFNRAVKRLEERGYLVQSWLTDRGAKDITLSLTPEGRAKAKELLGIKDKPVDKAGVEDRLKKTGEELAKFQKQVAPQQAIRAVLAWAESEDEDRDTQLLEELKGLEALLKDRDNK